MHDKQLGTAGTNQLVSSVQNTLTLCNGLYHVGGRVAMMLAVCCVDPGYCPCASRVMEEYTAAPLIPVMAQRWLVVNMEGLTRPVLRTTGVREHCMESLEMEAVLHRPRPPAQRWLTGLLTVGGLILVTVPNAPASLGELLQGTPTPTPTSAPGGDRVYYAH